MDQITPSDLQLFRDAQAQLKGAEATLQFVSGHLSRVYGLTQDVQVDLNTGAITRPEDPPPAPSTEESPDGV